MTKQEGVSFVWPKNLPFTPWAGGSETYTLRQIDELQNQGIDARLILHEAAPESDLENISAPVELIRGKQELNKLGDVVIFALEESLGCEASELDKPSYVFLHTPDYGKNSNLRGHTPLVPSRFLAQYWERRLGLSAAPSIVYPPIDEAFSRAVRAESTGRVLFAGRPCVDKGVFTLLASIHCEPLNKRDNLLTCIQTVNNNDPATTEINNLFTCHPRINTLPAQPTPQAMAKIMAAHDVVVMPSIWEEPFGMLSVEAQHAGCRVVASDIGGLAETDCGGVSLVEPGNPYALARGIAAALENGPLSPYEREVASLQFTAKTSVFALRHALNI